MNGQTVGYPSLGPGNEKGRPLLSLSLSRLSVIRRDPFIPVRNFARDEADHPGEHRTKPSPLSLFLLFLDHFLSKHEEKSITITHTPRKGKHLFANQSSMRIGKGGFPVKPRDAYSPKTKTSNPYHLLSFCPSSCWHAFSPKGILHDVDARQGDVIRTYNTNTDTGTDEVPLSCTIV